MKTLIWKVQLELTDKQIIELRSGYRILSVQVQNGQICLWYMFPEQNRNIKDRIPIWIHGTGNPIEDSGNAFLGTVQLNNFVWHIFTEV